MNDKKREGQDIEYLPDYGTGFHYIPPEITHTYHHYDTAQPTVNVSVERNSRGVTWSATVNGAHSVAEAMELLDKARDELSHRYGSTQVVP